MINFLSNWAKNLGLAIIIVSILEMVLPNNKTKKYIKMVMGTYVLFCMISPFIKNKVKFSDTDFENYIETSSTSELNQESIDKKINQLYIEELEKNITTKVQEQGYIVNSCNVEVTIADNVQETKIDKIKLDVEALDDKKKEDKIEDRLVSEIQKIKKVNTTVDTTKENKKTKLTETQKKELKKFLKEEYEVKEKCLVIT